MYHQSIAEASAPPRQGEFDRISDRIGNVTAETRLVAERLQNMLNRAFGVQPPSQPAERVSAVPNGIVALLDQQLENLSGATSEMHALLTRLEALF